ncbi:MAG: TetR family transcriptional regulator [Bacteroidetes bacterium OLB10]|nr:MAG: TetR family transcriptional regulator [Bacteroidetes bacterium OLB10]
MASRNNSKIAEQTTEERIKEAARKVFQKKGFAATRTRDIAEEAGINLALLNYYFRSKEKLFEIIMLETLFGFMQNLAFIMNDDKSTLQTKVELIASGYIDFIIRNPNVPLFMLSEMRANSGGLLKKLPIKQLVSNSAFLKQHRKAVEEGKIAEPHPLHFLMNLLGLIVFPFIGKPMLQGISGVSDNQFKKIDDAKEEVYPGLD